MAPTASTTTKTSSKGYKFGERGSHHIVLGGDGTHPYSYPKFTTKQEERKFILEHTACTFRVFASRGYSEGEAGHCSVRDPIDKDTFG